MSHWKEGVHQSHPASVTRCLETFETIQGGCEKSWWQLAPKGWVGWNSSRGSTLYLPTQGLWLWTGLIQAVSTSKVRLALSTSRLIRRLPIAAPAVRVAPIQIAAENDLVRSWAYEVQYRAISPRNDRTHLPAQRNARSRHTRLGRSALAMRSRDA